MTDTNSTLLHREPFTRHTAYTLWRLQENPAGPSHKPVKVPVHWDGTTRHSLGRPARKGRDAVQPNPAPPLTAEQAAGWLAHNTATGVGHTRAGEVGYLSAGFRPEGTGLVCVDLDDCVVDGQWTPGAAALFARFPGALIESSVSGRGAHIWFTAAGVGRRPKKITPFGEIEVYGAGQFIAMGQILAGDASVDHTAAVHAMVAEFWPDAAGVGRQSADWDEVAEGDRARVIEEIRSTFPVLDQSTYAEWTARGMALTTLGDDIGLPLWHELSALHPDYDEDECEQKWFQLHATRTGYQALFSHAEGRGWVNPRKRQPLPSDASAVFEVSMQGLPAGAVLEAPASRQVATTGDAGLSFMAASGGSIAASVASVEAALMSSESGILIAYDTFLEQTSISIGGEPPRAFEDEDYGDLRARLERRGFKPVAAEVMRTVVGMVAKKNRFDSAIQWVTSLQWDGVPRIGRAMQNYYGCDDNPYASAVGEYLFTGLAGRCTVPGIKADMAVILVGLQGARKTSAVEALSPTPEAFGEIDLSKSDDALARSMRGKLVVELAELKGLSGRDSDSIKAWFSRRVEEWRPVYREAHIRYGRRSITIGTDNVGEFLDDPTGARRFLPIRVGPHVDIDALVRDRDQLWAEGLARFKQSGIAWEQAEILAKEEHVKFEVVDENLALVAAWLAAPPTPMPGHPIITTPRGSGPVRGVDVLTTALNYTPAQIKKADQMMLAKIMRRLNFTRSTKWIDGTAVKLWIPPLTTSK
jgi:hypothetical protein